MIEHLSGSSMNTYDTNIHEFYQRYVLGEEPIYCENIKNAMEFGKQYELALWEELWDKYSTQKECEEIIWGYKMYGLFDFYNEWDKMVIECKTKSWERKEKDIHNSWQFRFYNWWCNKEWYEFRLHQFNKKTWDIKEEIINWDDKNFEQDFVERAKEIERFLKQFNIELQRYDIQKN